MANYAAIIDTLSVSGSRLTDGTANASGKVWLFQPSTSTPVTAYSNAAATTVVTQPIVLGAGGRLPSELSGGLFVTQPVRLYIEDVAGNVVSDSVYIPATAGDVGLNNAGWTGTTEDQAWTALYTSVGGVDGKYLESGGATARTIKAKFAEQGISVKDFGAVGDGVAIDTTAIQQAMNRAAALSTNVLFPAGTYRTDQALTLTSATGVSIVGAGLGATIISCTNGTADAFTLSGCTNFALRGFTITHATSSTGNAVALAACSGVSVDTCELGAGTFDICVNASGAGSDLFIQRSSLFGLNASATGRGLKTTYVRTAVSNTFIRSTGGAGIEFTGAASDGSVYACDFSVNGSNLVGILFNAATGARFCISDNPSLGVQATPIDVSAQTLWPNIIQHGNNVVPATLSFATGTTVTPIIKLGNEIRLTASSGGAGTVTVADPAVLPGTVPGTDLYYDFVFKNAAGGAVVWDFTGSTVYDIAAAIPTTAAHTIQVRFRWDTSTGSLREQSRADTLT